MKHKNHKMKKGSASVVKKGSKTGKKARPAKTSTRLKR